MLMKAQGSRHKAQVARTNTRHQLLVGILNYGAPPLAKGGVGVGTSSNGLTEQTSPHHILVTRHSSLLRITYHASRVTYYFFSQSSSIAFCNVDGFSMGVIWKLRLLMD